MCSTQVRTVKWDRGEKFKDIAERFETAEDDPEEFVLFARTDAEPITQELIRELSGYCAQERVGAVGAKVYGPDGRILHAGGFVRQDGSTADAFRGFLPDDPGYFGRAVTAQEVSAVSGMCMMIRASVLSEVLDGPGKPADSAALCAKIREAGYRIVFDPFAWVSVQIPAAHPTGKRNASPIEDPLYNPSLAADRALYDLGE